MEVCGQSRCRETHARLQELTRDFCFNLALLRDRDAEIQQVAARKLKNEEKNVEGEKKKERRGKKIRKAQCFLF
jgi:hypothetical protein